MAEDLHGLLKIYSEIIPIGKQVLESEEAAYRGGDLNRAKSLQKVRLQLINVSSALYGMLKEDENVQEAI